MSKTSGWFSGIREEWRHITWPSGRETVKKTGAVIVISAVLGVLIAMMDSGFRALIAGIAGFF